MKKKLYIIVGVSVMTLLLVWWLRPKNVQHSIASSKPDQQAKVASPSATVGDDSTVTPDDVAKTPWTGTDEQKRARISEVRDIAQKANQLISFYGKVID